MPWFMLLVLVLGSGHSSPTPRNPDETEDVLLAGSIDPVLGLVRKEASLNEMFQEVEELMEDTQQKLKKAVQEMEVEEESLKATTGDVNPGMLPPNYHNVSNTETTVGNQTIDTHQEIDKATDSQTGSTIYSETVIQSVEGDEVKRNHECFVHEDCGTGKYCQFSSFEYKCLLCKSHEKCSQDAECCDGAACVWGVCTNGTSKGDSGRICQRQQDCNDGLCCAIQMDLLFPVCSSLPAEGERCYDSSDKLLDIITWGMEPGGVLDRCPCDTGLTCQTQSDDLVSVCQRSSIIDEIRSNEEEYTMEKEELPLFSEIPTEVVDDFDKINIIQAMDNEFEDILN